jgi:hypothetical protein
MGRYVSSWQPSIDTRDLISDIVLSRTRTAYSCFWSALRLLIQNTQSPICVSWVARTGDTSGAPESFAVVKAALTSSASFFSSGGSATARILEAGSASMPAQPLTAKHKSIVRHRGHWAAKLLVKAFSPLRRPTKYSHHRSFVTRLRSPPQRRIISGLRRLADRSKGAIARMALIARGISSALVMSSRE